MKKNPKKVKKDLSLSKEEFEQKVIEIARVSRVVAGGKRMRFRACVVIGDLKGKLGVGVRKGADVSMAIEKAVRAAKKNLIKVEIVNETIPHEVRVKFKSAKILIKPAPKGTGIIAGGPVRSALELSGINNIVAKMLGSNNKINNVRAVIKALSSFKKRRRLLSDKTKENKEDRIKGKE